MNLSVTLLVLLALQNLLFGAGWWLGATRLQLPRVPALHWTAFCLVASGGLLLFLPEVTGRSSLAVPLGNVAMVAACMLARRGALRFLRQSPADAEQAMLLLGMAGGTLLAGPWGRQLLLSACVGWVLLRLGRELVAGVGREFGERSGWALGLPALLLGTTFLFRAAAAFALGAAGPAIDIADPGGGNVVLLVAVWLCSTLFQGGLLVLVILRLVRKLQRLARHDALTGLLNRRAWEQALRAERLRLVRHPRPTALLLLDIDHFKQINDRHGHEGGDRVLAAVAAALRRGARDSDVLARLGGEEFGVLLPDTDEAGAWQAGERLRSAVAALVLPLQGQQVSVTISVGVAVLPPLGQDDLRLALLLRRADRALYRAKDAGRNRVVLAEEPGQGLRLADA